MIEFECNDMTIRCTKEEYIRAKIKDLIEFGYSTLTDDEVAKQLQLVLEGNNDLTVIGKFIERDEVKEIKEE